MVNPAPSSASESTIAVGWIKVLWVSTLIPLEFSLLKQRFSAKFLWTCYYKFRLEESRLPRKKTLTGLILSAPNPRAQILPRLRKPIYRLHKLSPDTVPYGT